eukprot:2584552-Pyramimonas_sp.AAC.1
MTTAREARIPRDPAAEEYGNTDQPCRSIAVKEGGDVTRMSEEGGSRKDGERGRGRWGHWDGAPGVDPHGRGAGCDHGHAAHLPE